MGRPGYRSRRSRAQACLGPGRSLDWFRPNDAVDRAPGGLAVRMPTPWLAAAVSYGGRDSGQDRSTPRGSRDAGRHIRQRTSPANAQSSIAWNCKNTRQRRDLAGADAVMLAGPCHVASVRQLCALLSCSQQRSQRSANGRHGICVVQQIQYGSNTKARQTQSGHSPCWTKLRANATAWSSSWSKWVDVWPMAQTSTPPTQRAPSVPRERQQCCQLPVTASLVVPPRAERIKLAPLREVREVREGAGAVSSRGAFRTSRTSRSGQ